MMELWIGRDGERHGPYKEEDVREWIRSGQVSRDDLAWYEGLADWQPLSVLFPDVAVDAPAAAASTAASTAAIAPTAAAPLPRFTSAALEDYAGFWKRVAAYILDAIILFLPNMLIMNMMGDGPAKAAAKQAAMSAGGNMQAIQAAQLHYYSEMWPAYVLTLILGWLYFALLESSSWQATLGKLALGIRVTDLHGQRISVPRALGRYPAKILSAIILGVGFLMAGWTQRKQALHDMIVGTLVLNGRASEFKPNATPSGASPSGGSDSFSA